MTVQRRHPSSTTGGTIRTARPDQQPHAFPKGRRCTHGGCITRLHQYHDGDRCYVHERPKQIKFLGSMDNRVDVADAQELFAHEEAA